MAGAQIAEVNSQRRPKERAAGYQTVISVAIEMDASIPSQYVVRLLIEPKRV
jgi:hypothetical protein